MLIVSLSNFNIIVFFSTGIEYTGSDLISVRVKALNPGKANIQAIVTTPKGKQTIFVEITGTHLNCHLISP